MTGVLVDPSVPLNLALVLIAGTRWCLAPWDRKRTFYVLAALTGSILLVDCALPLVSEISRLRPMKYDQFIYQLSARIGSPSFIVGEVVRRSAALRWLVSTTYGVLHIAILVAFTVNLYLRPKEVGLLIRCFVANVVMAVPIYMLIPVSGPRYAFPGFPSIPHIQSAQLIPVSAAPNGIPSVHMSSALLVLWFLRRWPKGRAFGIAFVLLTATATLGTGEHYLLDLICAIPYAALVYWVCSRPFWSTAPVQAEPELDATAA
jgi:hypothetical protein